MNSQVIEDQVTLRVKVTKDNKSQSDLKKNNFSIYIDCKQQNVNQECQLSPGEFDFRNPQQSTPLPTRIVLLLDLSGSMKKLDKGGEPKLQGAVNAIQEFINILAERQGDNQMAIVPFSDQGTYTSCESYEVTNNELNNFSSPANQEEKQQLKNYLSQLQKNRARICGETNLYQSLAKTVSFLGDFNLQNQSQNGNSNQPQLHVVLLSDGFDTAGFDKSSKNRCDTNHFAKLKAEILEQYRGVVTIHTLGYGRTPQELGKIYQLPRGKSAECTDIEKIANREERQNFESELVDQKHLQQIADFTGGIHEFSGNAKEISQRFKDILNTILDEYQITYTQKNADTASKHNVRVVVNSVASEEVSYSMPFVFLVPFNIRLWIIFIFVILPLSFAIFLLYLLAGEIKKQAQ
ncbi:MAG: VWA domain-containing protein [Desmonostoc vinosum HA7617-LM4]|nr:VWA domain-containing protein [Desmonostoc vinosum HA7617-LM4]